MVSTIDLCVLILVLSVMCSCASNFGTNSETKVIGLPLNNRPIETSQVEEVMFSKTKPNGLNEEIKIADNVNDKSAVASVNKQIINKPIANSSSELVLEGGGKVETSTTFAKADFGIVTDDSSHSRGSKGRKGVQFPGSSVVPRKGVDQGTSVLNITFGSAVPGVINQQSSLKNLKHIGLGTEKESYSNANVQKPQTEQIQPPVNDIHKAVHAKKPEMVSDIGDEDDFDNYAIIKTSTTGEDYIIIGIVIVMGIWCSVFGALIFYRRAGEYWDRRHYRRMDFLVEGMYND